MNGQSGNDVERQEDYLRDYHLETLGSGDDLGADSLSEVLDSCKCESKATFFMKDRPSNYHGLDCSLYEDES